MGRLWYGPRVGFAYQLTSRTVLRDGYGMYYSNNYLELSNAGFNITGSFTTLDNGVTPAFRLRDGFPQNFRQEPSIDPTFQNRNARSFVEQSAVAMPRTQNWPFSIQRELARDIQIEASASRESNICGGHRDEYLFSDTEASLSGCGDP